MPAPSTLTLGVAPMAATPAPVGAAPEDSDALVFVSASGQGLAIRRAGLASVGSSPVDRVDHAVAGDFTGAAGSGVLLYAAGSAPDAIVSVRPAGTGYEISTIPKTVKGIYTPIVGDFDADGIDDVLWYGAGSGPDSLWRFAGDGSHTGVPLTISGTYQPTVLDADGDGHDDVLWYAPGPAADSLWLFGAGASHTSKPVTVNGRYQVLAGRFGDAPQEGLVFADAQGRGSRWTFDAAGDHTSAPVPASPFRGIVGDFHGTGRDDIFWYGVASDVEALTCFAADGAASIGPAPPVSGRYDPVVLDADGDGDDDIAWTRAGRATIWMFGVTPPGWPYPSHTQVTFDSGILNGLAVATDGRQPA